jgi:hypothetical protein
MRLCVCETTSAAGEAATVSNAPDYQRYDIEITLLICLILVEVEKAEAALRVLRKRLWLPGSIRQDEKIPLLYVQLSVYIILSPAKSVLWRRLRPAVKCSDSGLFEISLRYTRREKNDQQGKGAAVLRDCSMR